MNIKGNELTDKVVKKGTELQHVTPKSYISLAFIKRKIKEMGLANWNNIWTDSIAKNKHYSQFECKPKWKQAAKIVKKQVFSSLFQLKSGHGYFKSYLNRALDACPNICFIYNTKENPEHLILNCKRYSSIRNKIKKEKQLNQLSLKMLFSSKQGQDFLFEYIIQTGIATRKNMQNS